MEIGDRPVMIRLVQRIRLMKEIIFVVGTFRIPGCSSTDHSDSSFRYQRSREGCSEETRNQSTAVLGSKSEVFLPASTVRGSAVAWFGPWFGRSVSHDHYPRSPIVVTRGQASPFGPPRLSQWGLPIKVPGQIIGQPVNHDDNASLPRSLAQES